MAVAHPCDEVSLESAVEAAKLGLIQPILVGPIARIRAAADGAKLDIGSFELDRCRAQPGFGREGRPAREVGPRRGSDEGQPAHRRADGGSGGARRRHPHRAPHQPLLHHGRARPRRCADHHRCRREHRARPRGRKSHIVQNAIDLAHAMGVAGRAGRDPERDGDGQSQGALDDRGRRPVQDGRSRPDHRRACSTVRWRSTTRSAPRLRRSSTSSRRSPAAPMSWSCPISKRATCWPRACRSWPAPTPPASCWARACRSC